MTGTPHQAASLLAGAHDSARTIPCECGAPGGRTCDSSGGIHLVRYATARSLGLLTDSQMTAVLHTAGAVFTSRTLIRHGRTAPAYGHEGHRVYGPPPDSLPALAVHTG